MSAFKAFQKRVEEQIQEAMEKGEFENLPGRGKPLDLEEDAQIAPELRMAYKILKNSGFPPEEVLMAKNVEALQRLLLSEKDMTEEERARLKKKIMMADTELNMRMERFRKQYGGY